MNPEIKLISSDAFEGKYSEAKKPSEVFKKGPAFEAEFSI